MQQEHKTAETKTEIPDLHIPEDIQRPAAKGSGRGLIVPSKTSVVKEIAISAKHSIQVRHGDLSKEDSAVIVNPANEHLHHNSGIAGTILRNGGRKIKKESDDYIAAHGKLAVGQVAVTSGGNLACKFIVHANAPNWKETDQDVAEYILTLKNCIAATIEKKGDSIAIPALSQTFPKNLAAVLTFQAILEHWKSDQNSCIAHVRFTNNDLETVTVFKDEFVRRQKENFAASPLPTSLKDLLNLLPMGDSSKLLEDDNMDDMFESLAAARAQSGKPTS